MQQVLILLNQQQNLIKLVIQSEVNKLHIDKLKNVTTEVKRGTPSNNNLATNTAPTIVEKKNLMSVI